MITYVNTVLVGTGVGSLASTIAGATNGQYVVVDNNGAMVSATEAPYAEAIKVGLKTPKGIKWSNIIKKADIKSYTYTAYDTNKSAEDAVYIDLSGVTVSTLQGNRLVVRITYKDLPTKFRKWTESYDIEVGASATLAQIAKAIADKINGENKRARVTATVGAINTTSTSNNGVLPGSKYYHIDSNWGTSTATTGTVVQLVGMAYDDDDTVDSISPANKVRFSVNSWFTKPAASGFASKNKYSVDGAKIVKVPGDFQVGEAKLVRDAEAQAMGYLGIINRGEGTWPIIRPDMNVDLSKKYDTITLEFENMYRAADDIFRKTKQTLQVFERTDATKALGAASASLKAVLDAFVKGEHATVVLGTKDVHEATIVPSNN